jgi:hypothetical protein
MEASVFSQLSGVELLTPEPDTHADSREAQKIERDEIAQIAAMEPGPAAVFGAIGAVA